jgi:hypothetical protein
MTVSRVINGSDRVSRETRQRVEQAIAEVGDVRAHGLEVPRIEGRAPRKNRVVVLPAQFVVRKSCGAGEPRADAR